MRNVGKRPAHPPYTPGSWPRTRTEYPDSLTIYGQDGLTGGTVDCCNDHRIAMMAAIAATRCREPVTLLGAECVAKSYPDFWEHYRMLGLDHPVALCGILGNAPHIHRTPQTVGPRWRAV